MYIPIAVVLVLLLVAVVATAVFLTRRIRQGGTDMGLLDFLRHLLLGRGYGSLSLSQLHRRLEDGLGDAVLVDLRDPTKTAQGHIDGARLRPMDDFLRDVVVDEVFADRKDTEILLICDTDHMSRVVAAILAEDEGYTRVSSVRGGMEAWATFEPPVRGITACESCGTSTSR